MRCSHNYFADYNISIYCRAFSANKFDLTAAQNWWIYRGRRTPLDWTTIGLLLLLGCCGYAFYHSLGTFFVSGQIIHWDWKHLRSLSLSAFCSCCSQDVPFPTVSFLWHGFGACCLWLFNWNHRSNLCLHDFSSIWVSPPKILISFMKYNPCVAEAIHCVGN